MGLGRCERFAGAVTLARPTTARGLYLSALATLVSGKEQIPILDAVFHQVFGGLAGVADQRGNGSATGTPGRSPAPEDLLAKAAEAARMRSAGSRGTPEAGSDGAPDPP